MYEGKYDESEDHARKAIENTPSKATAHLALAQALYMLDRYEESVTAAELGITLVEDDVSLLPPAKDAVRANLHYQLSFNYRELGDTVKQAQHEQTADELLAKGDQE